MQLARLWPLAAALLVGGCNSSSSPGDAAPPPLITTLPRGLSPSEQALLGASSRFGPALLARVNASRAGENVFLSPLSASMALGMTMNGAEGSTFEEMRSTLGFGAMSQQSINESYRDLIALLRGLDSRVDFRIANSIWYRDSFAAAIAPTFLAESRQYFDATTGGLDFDAPASVTTINDWVKTGTNGKIPTIIESLPNDLVMLLVNAIYFKGDWREAFDKQKTASGAFTTEAGGTVMVPLMHRTTDARAGDVDGRTVVELGYGGDAFAMTIVLPRPGESVNTLVSSLSDSVWRAAIASLHGMEVELTMPRFSMSWNATLNDPLRAMGMPTAFAAGGADFSRISPSRGRDLFISFVTQKTFVDVNEVGTEAAAATAVGVGVTSLPQRRVVRVDRPFVFAIRERLSGAILFLGKIVQPTSGA